MWLGIFFGIIAQLLGIDIIYKAKINKDDSEEKKRQQKKSKIMGIFVLVIGCILTLFSLLFVMI